MATVDSGTLILDREQANGTRLVRYSFVLTDNNTDTKTVESTPKTVPADFDTTADMLEVGPRLLDAEAEAETREIIAACERGERPIHVDMGGFFVKVVLLWQTWDEGFAATAHHFFSLPDQIDLAPYHPTWSLVSKQDKTGILGVDNQTESDMNADVQIAIDLQTQLDSYTPYFDEDGNII